MSFEALEDVPESVRDELQKLYGPAIDAVEASVKATTERRVDVQCPSCQHKFRKRLKFPDTKLRFEAARWLAEQRLGRAALKPVSQDTVGETTVFFHSVHFQDEPEVVELLQELAQAVIADTYDTEPSKARAIAKRIYQSRGRFTKSCERVTDVFDDEVHA